MKKRMGRRLFVMSFLFVILALSMIFNQISHDSKVSEETSSSKTTCNTVIENGSSLQDNSLNINKELPFNNGANEIKVSFYTNGGPTLQQASVEYNSLLLRPTDPVRDGFMFAGWYIDNITFLTEYDFNTPVTEAFTLYAKWIIYEQTVWYETEYDYESELVLPIPAKTGYTFEGWYTDIERTIPFDLATMPAEDITLYAKWVINEYTVTFECNGGLPLAPLKQEYGVLISQDNPVREGYNFKGWYSDSALTQQFDFPVYLVEDFTVYAAWEEIVFGSITRDPGLTGGDCVVTIDGDTITFDGEIQWYFEDEQLGREYGNRVGVQINAPESSEIYNITVVIEENTYTTLFDEKNFFWWYPLVTQAGQEFTATVTWNSSSVQVFTIVISENATFMAPIVSGTIERDPAFTGGSECTAIVNGDTITFDGLIEWYFEDEQLGREYGNRVGVQINAPVKYEYDASEAMVTIGEDTYSALFNSEKLYFWWYPLVTEAGQEFIATVTWNSSSVQTFTIVISENAAFMAPIVSGTIERDPAFTGGEDCTVQIDEDTIIFDGEIKWYPEDLALARERGNRVGVQINAPNKYEYDPSIATVSIGEDTYSALFNSGKLYFWWYPLVTEAGQEFTATVTWNSSSVQTFVIVITENSTLQPALNKIIFDKNFEEATGFMDDQEIREGSSEQLNANGYERVGYSFIGWAASCNGEVVYNDQDMYLMGSEPAYTLYAVWKVNQYKITYVVDYNYGETINPFGPTREGYIFGGWFLDPQFLTPFDFSTMPSEDITLYAKWIEESQQTNDYSISFNSNGGSYVPALTLVEGGTISELPTPERTGYNFLGWYTDEECINLFELTVMPDYNVSLYAGWIDVLEQLYNEKGEIFIQLGWSEPLTYTNDYEEIDMIIFELGVDIAQPMSMLYMKEIYCLNYSNQNDALNVYNYLYGIFNFESGSNIERIESVIFMSMNNFAAFLIYDVHIDSDTIYIEKDDDIIYVVYMGSDEHVVIPETYLDKNVTEIGSQAFAGNKNVLTVTLPKTIINIKNSAFQNCINLTSVMISVDSQLKYIGNYAFGFCSRLTHFTVPDSVERIGRYAFAGNVSLASFELPNNNVFDTLEENLLSGCYSLTSIILPENIKYVNDKVFTSSGLINISFSPNIEYIGQLALEGTPWYDSLNYGIIYTGKLLYGYKGEIPKNTTINVLPGTEYINPLYSNNIVSVNIPASVRKISGIRSDNLESINVDSGNCYYQSLEGVLFNKSLTELLIYPAQKTNTVYSVPNGVIYIKEGAFVKNYFLEELNIADSVEVIEYYAIVGCSFLTYVNISVNSMLKQIECTFEHTNLYTFYVPAGVSYINKWAFYSCLNLNAIDVDEYNIYYQSLEGVLFNKSLTELLIYPAQKTNTVYSVPDGIIYIKEGAFVNNKSLEELIIADSVEIIEYFAIAGCSSLTYININVNSMLKHIECTFNGTNLYTFYVPAGVSYINERAFYSCHNLYAINVDENNTYYKSSDGVLFNEDCSILIRYPEGKTNSVYTIPSSVTTIAEGSISGCGFLREIVIPDTVVVIGREAFKFCNNLDNIIFSSNSNLNRIEDLAFGQCYSLALFEIPEGVTYIGNFAFEQCGLINIYIPRYVSFIGSKAFWGCNYLENIYVDENNTYYKSSYGVLFSKDGSELICYPIGKSDESYSVPEDTIHIGDNAFSRNASLVEINLPDSVKTIGEDSFAYCYNLLTIEIFALLPPEIVKYRTFENGYFTIMVPYQSLYEYKTAEKWTYYSDKIKSSLYTISFRTDGETIIPDIIQEGGTEVFEPTAPIKEGFIFAGWFIDNESFKNPFFFNYMPEDYTILYAKWVVEGQENDSYLIYFNSNGGSYVPALTLVKGDTISELPTPERTGYSFLGWYTDEECINLFELTVMPDYSVSLYAGWIDVLEQLYNEKGEIFIQLGSPEPLIYTNDYEEIDVFFNELELYIERPMSMLYMEGVYCFNFSNLNNALNAYNYINSLLDFESEAEDFSIIIIDSVVFLSGYGLADFLIYDVFIDSDAVYIEKNGVMIYVFYTGSDEHVVIPETYLGKSVTEIGYGAFSGNSNLLSVTLPKTLIIINGQAFYACSNLISVTIPIDSHLKYIGNYAFEYCTSLTHFTVPDSVEKIGRYAFSRNVSLESFELPNNNVFDTLEESLFRECYSLTSIILPDTIKNIKYQAFYESGLINISFSPNIEYVGQYVFEYTPWYDSLADGIIYIGKVLYGYKGEIPKNTTINVLPGTVHINSLYSNNLVCINIPSSVRSIDEIRCSSLQSINVDSDNSYYQSSNGILFNKSGTELLIYPAQKTNAVYYVPDGIIYIKDGAFLDNSFLEELFIADSVEVIESYAINNCQSLTYVHISINSMLKQIECTFEHTNLYTFYVPAGVSYINKWAFYSCLNLNAINVDENNNYYSSIDGILFNKDGSTIILYPKGRTDTIYTIPDSVVNIDEYTFYYNHNLKKIIITENVNYIGYSAFNGCSNIIFIEIRGNLTIIEGSAFYEIKNIIINTDLSAEIFDCTFDYDTRFYVEDAYYNSYMENWFWNQYAVYRKSIIDENGFAVENGILLQYFGQEDYIILPETVESLDENAFRGQGGSISFIEFGTNIAVIDANIINSCHKLLGIKLNSLTPPALLYSFNHINCIYVPAQSVEDYKNAYGWFEHADRIYSYGSIDSEGFVIEDGILIQYLGDDKHVILPENVTVIRAYAFDNTKIESITLNSNVSQIEYYIFSGCEYLENIYVSENNSQYSSLNGVLYSKDGTQLLVYPRGKKEVSFTVSGSVNIIRGNAFNFNNYLKTVIISEGVYQIKANAFSNCTNLLSVTIPASVWEIEVNVFNYCYNLKNIYVNQNNYYYKSENGVLFSKNGATLIYYPKGKTNSVYTVPSSVTTIAQAAFSGCSLREIIIPDSVTVIGREAFWACSSLVNVFFSSGSNLNRIEDSAFGYCYSLAYFDIPEGVTYIGSFAFGECGLINIYIPTYVSVIGSNAFVGCYYLENIYVDENNTYYKSSDGVLFSKDGTELICFPKGKLYYNYSVPEDVIHIGDNAFSQNASLVEIYLPDSVKTIGNHSFAHCYNLSFIRMSSSLESIGSFAFYNCQNLNYISLPETLVYIGDYAFHRCYNLNYIALPESILYIGYSAFSDCDNLCTIEIFALLPPQIEISPFGSGASLTIMVPYQSLYEYKTAENWSYYSNIIKSSLYTISFRTDGGTIIPDIIQEGGTYVYEPAAPIKEGFIFVGWFIDDGSFENAFFFDYMPEDYTILYAKWIEEGQEDDSYTIYFNSNGGTFVPEISLPSGSVVTEPEAPTKTGYNFLGWYTDEECTVPYAFNYIEDITLYAGWEIKSYTVTFNGNGGMLTEGEEVQVIEHGESAIAPIYTREGYTFNGWDDSAFNNVTNCLTINAQWNINIYTVIFIGNEGILISGDTVQTVEHGGSATAPLFEKDGYALEWDISIACITSNITVTAQWIKTYIITFNGNGGTLVSGYETQTVKTGQSAIAPVYAKTGFYLIGWDIPFDNVMEDLTVNAQWETKTYTVIFNGNGGVLVSGEEVQTIEHGKSAIVPIYMREGFIFRYWNSSYNNITENKTISAYWEELFLVTFNGNGGLLVSGSEEQFVAYSYRAIAPVYTREGYTFAGWNVDFSFITSNITVIAQWSLNIQNSDGIVFTSFNSNDLTVIRYVGEQLNIVIPSQYESKQVTSISDNAFENLAIQTVEIPSTVVSIGDYAFSGCEDLTSVTFAEGSLLTTIGMYAFSYCSKILNISIPENVVSIGGNTFFFCFSLKIVYFNSNNYNVNELEFLSTTSLFANGRAIIVPITEIDTYKSINSFWNDNLAVIEDIIDNRYIVKQVTDGVGIVSYFGDDSNLVIPFTLNGQIVKSICRYAFSNCHNLNSVTIPEGVENIENEAFYSSSTMYRTLKIVRLNCSIAIDLTSTQLLSSRAALIVPDALYNTYRTMHYNYSDYFARENDIVDGKYIVRQVYGGVEILVYFGNDTDLIIPFSLNGETVRSIYPHAFSVCSKLKSVTIPAGLTNIKYYAFHYCYNLTNVYFEQGSQLSSIGNMAFNNCRSLVNITIPQGVNDLGVEIFNRCDSLTSINVEEGNQYYKSIEGNLYNNDQTLFIRYSPSKTDTFFAIPNTVTSIAQGAFLGCKNLISVVLPEGVRDIGNYAFQECTNLFSILLPETLINIGNNAFNGCIKLESIYIPGGVQNIYTQTFANCSNLKYVTLSEGLISIGSFAFYNCSLTDIIIPNSVTNIDEAAFKSCYSLESIIMPEGVTVIKNETFWGCSSLININIVSGLTSIGNSAFTGCSSLESITLSENITSMGYNVFSNCSKLVIYTQLSEINGWANNWNSSRPIVLNCILSEDGVYVVSIIKSSENIQYNYYTYPQNYIFTNPYYVGHTFEGWYTTEDFSGTRYETVAVAPEGILYAKWTEKA